MSVAANGNGATTADAATAPTPSRVSVNGATIADAAMNGVMTAEAVTAPTLSRVSEETIVAIIVNAATTRVVAEAMMTGGVMTVETITAAVNRDSVFKRSSA